MNNGSSRAYRRTLTILSITAMCIAGSPPAAIASPNSYADNVASLIEASAPSETLSEVTAGVVGVVPVGDPAAIVVPRVASDPIQIENKGVRPSVTSELAKAGITSAALPDLEVTLPKEFDVADAVVADDGTSVYAGEDGSVAVQILAGGSVRMMTVLDNKDAPLEHTYSFGNDVEPVRLADGSVDLVAKVGDGVGVSIGNLDTPWAIDANGVDVETSYVVDGNSVRQVITPSTSTAFPVVADPKATTAYSSGIYRVYLWMLGSEWETARKIVTGVLIGVATAACLGLRFAPAVAKAISTACTLIGASTGYSGLRNALRTPVTRHTMYHYNCFRQVVYGPALPELMAGAVACR